MRTATLLFLLINASVFSQNVSNKLMDFLNYQDVKYDSIVKKINLYDTTNVENTGYYRGFVIFRVYLYKEDNIKSALIYNPYNFKSNRYDFSEDGQLILSNINDKNTTLHKEYYNNGTIKKICNIINDTLTLKCIEYYDTNKVKSIFTSDSLAILQEKIVYSEDGFMTSYCLAKIDSSYKYEDIYVLEKCKKCTTKELYYKNGILINVLSYKDENCNNLLKKKKKNNKTQIILYSQPNIINKIINIKNDKFNGWQTDYYGSTGIIHNKYKLKNNLLNGKSYSYYGTGRLYTIAKYKNGKLISLKKYSQNGEIEN